MIVHVAWLFKCACTYSGTSCKLFIMSASQELCAIPVGTDPRDAMLLMLMERVAALETAMTAREHLLSSEVQRLETALAKASVDTTKSTVGVGTRVVLRIRKEPGMTIDIKGLCACLRQRFRVTQDATMRCGATGLYFWAIIETHGQMWFTMYSTECFVPFVRANDAYHAKVDSMLLAVSSVDPFNLDAAFFQDMTHSATYTV